MSNGYAEAAPAVLELQGLQEPSVLAVVPVLVVGCSVAKPSSPVVMRWFVSIDLMKFAIVLIHVRTCIAVAPSRPSVVLGSRRASPPPARAHQESCMPLSSCIV